MDDARTAGAPDYARAYWADAEAARLRLDAELGTADEPKMKALCSDVVAAAQRARAASTVGKARARDRAARSLEDARELLREVGTLAASSARAPATREKLATCRGNAAVTGGTFEMAENAFAEGRYLEAAAVADAVSRELVKIRTEIDAAMWARSESKARAQSRLPYSRNRL